MEWQRTVATPGVAGVAVFVAGVPGGGLSGALTFTVTPAPAKLSVDPPSITLLSAGGASPPAQIISVLDSGGGSLKWSAQTRVLSPTGDNWLAAPNAGSSAPGSPGLISVTADPTLTLAPVGNGYYAGANPVFAKIPNLGATAIVNAASYAGGALAQGSIFSLFGTNIAGASTTAGAIPLPATLSGASVTIGGIPAPIFYAGAGQVNAQVPFELPPNSQQQIRVSYQ